MLTWFVSGVLTFSFSVSGSEIHTLPLVSCWKLLGKLKGDISAAEASRARKDLSALEVAQLKFQIELAFRGAETRERYFRQRPFDLPPLILDQVESIAQNYLVSRHELILGLVALAFEGDRLKDLYGIRVATSLRERIRSEARLYRYAKGNYQTSKSIQLPMSSRHNELLKTLEIEEGRSRMQTSLIVGTLKVMLPLLPLHSLASDNNI